MLNKRGIFLTILVFAILSVALIAGLVYLKIRFGGVEFKTGNVVVKLDYEKEQEKEPSQEIQEYPEVTNETNSTSLLNVSVKDNNITTD